MDLEIHLAAGAGGRGRVTLLRAGSGEALAAGEVAPADWLPARRQWRAICARKESPDRETLRQLGTELGGCLPAAVRERVARELREASGSPRAPRLRFCEHDPALAGMPWEYLPAGGLAALEALEDPPVPAPARTGIHILRLPVPAPEEAAPLSVDPVRVLLAWADPGSPNHPHLEFIGEEVRGLLELAAASAGRRVVVEELPYATRAALQRRLAEHPPHLFHFVGHGEVRPSGGALVLHGEEPRTEALLYGEELAGWLCPAETRVAVLGACWTAGTGGSVGECLSSVGVPAVVAMQGPFRDAAAGRFTRAFYSTLLAPCPVEEAVEAARRHLAAAGDAWGQPVLLLRSREGALFDLPEAPPLAPARPHPGSAGDGAAPVYLPYRRHPGFVGRRELLRELHGALAGEPQAAVLVGLGGSGKSHTAVEYAHRHRAEYPGGIFWLSARDSLRLRDELAGLGRFFGVPEGIPTRERAEWVRHELQRLNRPALLVVDNVTPETDLSLLPAVGGCRLLLTARLRHAAPPQFQALPVGPLEPESALELLRTGRVPENGAEQEAALQIAELLGHLALALALVAHHVRRLEIPFTTYRDRLAQPGRCFAVLENADRHFTPPTEPTTGIFDAIHLSCDALDAGARAVLGAAACSAGRSLSPALLFRWCGLTDPERFEEALADLTDYSLIQRDEERRITVHELVRSYAWHRQTGAEQQGVLDRAAAVLGECLARANEEMEWRDLRRDLAHCRAVARLGREVECGSRVFCRLLRELGTYAAHHGEFAAADGYLRDGLELARHGSGAAEAEAAPLLRQLGEVSQLRGDGAAALRLVREARRAAKRLLPPDDPELSMYANAVGYVLKVAGALRRALPFYERALRIAEAAGGGDSFGTAIFLNNLGAWHWSAGDLERARQHFERSLEVVRRVYHPRHPLAATRLNNLGRVQAQQGEWETAAAQHREALEIYVRTYGRRHLDVAMSLLFLADATARLGRPAEARQLYVESLAVQESIPTAREMHLRMLRERLEKLDQEEGAAVL